MRLRTIILLVLSVAILPSCTEDQEIGMNLEGSWRGAMSVNSEYGGHEYQAVYSDVRFEGDPFRTTRGDGYWVDHYRNSGWRRGYIANHIRWRVEDQVIHILLKEDDVELEIRVFHLNNETFTGIVTFIDENGREVSHAPFAMTHIDDSDWNGYNYDRPSNHRSWSKD